MASPDILDFETLLAPFPGENPAGVDVRSGGNGGDYRKLKDARNEAARAERNLLYKGGTDDQGYPLPPPDWRPVLELAPKVLAENAKDLEVVAFLIEALVRQHGFAGLRDGYRLARELVERYWEHLYPHPEEGEGLRERVRPLANLNGEDGGGMLIDPIHRVPITAGRSCGPYSLASLHDAVDVDRITDPEQRERRLQLAGAVTMDMFRKAVTETPPEFYRNLLDDLTQAAAEFEQLGQDLDARCGSDSQGPVAPPLSAIREALAECRREVENIARPLLGDATAAPAAQAGESPVVPAGTATPLVAADGQTHVQNREEAFRALLAVAEFFKRTEPQSPVAYLLEQAVRWGRMSLPDLLKELVTDAPTREQIYRLIGVGEKPSRD
jgi:type VI secretion system protein ImpA